MAAHQSRSTVSKIAYLNGNFVAHDEAALAFADRGLIWGAVVTDRCRTYRRRLFRWHDHLARFRKSCGLCAVPQPIADDRLTEIAQALLDENGKSVAADVEFVVVLVATPGGAAPALAVTAEPLDGARYRTIVESGARLATPRVRHIPNECIPRQAKMRSRMHWWLAEEEVKAGDASASALLLDLDGQVTETATSNIAVVRNGEIWTPPRELVLDGISLRVVEALAQKSGIAFREMELTLDICYSSDEMLVTSTPFGVAGVSRLNGKEINWPGPILQKLHVEWSQLVEMDIWHKILPCR